MVSVAIIGHGPSLTKLKCGPEIDSQDVVVRQKRSWNLLKTPEMFGSRTDYVLGSCTVGNMLINEAWTPIEYWLFTDTRTERVDPQPYIDSFQPHKCVLDIGLCKHWRNIYRQIRQFHPVAEGQERKGPLSDSMGHRHPSAGSHTVMYVLDRLKPDKITLFGYDNVLSGCHTWSLIRGPDWKEYPDHNWFAERLLLHKMCEQYGYICGESYKGKTEITKNA